MEEWKEYKLGELTERKIGYGIVQPGEHVPNGIPIIKVNNIISGLKCISDLDRTSIENDEKYKRTRLNGGEVIISIVGTIGKTAIVPKQFAGSNLVRATALIDIPDADKALWVKYYIDSPLGQAYIKGNLNTTVQPTLNIKSLIDMPIRMYSTEYMDKAIRILKSLDDKIEVNRRINEQLEELAVALFKSWFVDFEPFKDGEFVESELGMIPKGWKVCELQELVNIKRGGSPRPIQNFLAETGYKWLKISDATSTSSPFIYEIKECIKEEGLSKTVFLKAGNLVLSNSATPGIPKFLGIDSCIHDGWLYFPKSSLSNEFLYLLFKYKRNYLISQGNGSVFTNLKTDIVKMLQLAIPDDSIISSFDIVIKSIFENIKKNQQEIHHLTTLRDTLLPKLMSGEIDVNEVKI